MTDPVRGGAWENDAGSDGSGSSAGRGSRREPGRGADQAAPSRPGRSSESSNLPARYEYRAVSQYGAGGGEWLTEVLDSEYGGYEPDTSRIRTLLDERLESGSTARGPGGRARNPALRLRWAGIPAGIAAAALCGTVAVAVTATVTSSQPKSAPRASTSHGGLPAAGSSPSAGNGGSQSGSSGMGTHGAATGQATQPDSTAASPSGGPSASASSSAAVGGSYLSATGALAPASNANWTEEDVHITLAAPITALQLIIRVTPSAGLAPNSYWSDHNIKDFDVSVTSGANGLIYTFTLKPGKTIPAGTFTIAAQFTHNTQRDASGDTYSLSVTGDQAHGSSPAVSQGSF